MNPKQLAFLLALVAVLGGAGLLIYKKQNTSWTGSTAGMGQKLLASLPINDITHITIRQGSNQVNLVRKDDAWSVRERNDYPADFSQIRDFLIKAADLKAAQVDKVGPSQLPRLQLADGPGTNAATVVEFKGQNEKALQTLLLGKMHLRKSSPGSPAPFGEGGDEGWPDGRYVRTGSDQENVAIVSDPLERIEPRPEQWVTRDFIRVEKPRSIEVTFAAATNSWKLTRETESAEWKLADARPGEQLDSAKAAGVSSPLASESFSDVLPGRQLNGTNAPSVLKIETFDQFAYTVEVGSKTNEDYLMTVAVAAQIPKERTAGAEEKPEDKAKLDKEFKDKQQKLEEKLKQEQSYGKWTYRVPAWGIDSLLKERSQLLAEKKVEGTATNAVPPVEGEAHDHNH